MTDGQYCHLTRQKTFCQIVVSNKTSEYLKIQRMEEYVVAQKKGAANVVPFFSKDLDFPVSSERRVSGES